MNSEMQYSRLIARNNAETNAALSETTFAKNLCNFWRTAPYNRLRTNFMCLGYGVFPSFIANAFLSFYDSLINVQTGQKYNKTRICILLYFISQILIAYN